MRPIPRCMSTQHPDNVSAPFFTAGPVMGAEDEVREAYYAFSHLGCDEQMWDFEGKEVDAFVVEKLLASYEPFFRERRLGEAVFLTPRVPNPALERTQAKVLLEVLHSLPRHADAARAFYGQGRDPVFELIFPMTTSADELERVLACYRRYVLSIEDATVRPGDLPLASWFGEFSPKEIHVIPLVEDRPYLLAADAIVRDFLRGKDVAYQRVFIARSDPALNYGMASAVLLSLVALDRLHHLERELGVPLFPIIGTGGAPFRGNLRPATVGRCLATYPSVQTFTIQSAFKYDHPVEEVTAAIGALRSAPRRAPLPLADDRRALELVDKVSARYQAEVGELAPLVNTVARYIPRRRLRKLHIGLFGYSRGTNGMALPRAIPFAAALYSVGLPPEVLGLAALDADDWDWLDRNVPTFAADVADAIPYLDPDVVDALPPLAREAVVAALDRFATDGVDAEHAALARTVRARVTGGAVDGIGDLVLRAASRRRFLG